MKYPITFGKYLLLERVSIGGMAEVFKAKTFGVEGFERFVAVKRILPNMAEDSEFVSMFVDEARIAVQLTHANIAQIYELGKHEGQYYIAMEYIASRDLRKLLDGFRKRGEQMPIPMAAYIAAKMCEGLDHAHRKTDPTGKRLGIIHRDVSPQNCLVSYDGEIKVIDFGIAKAANRASKTQAGVLKGKFGYMSPEQVRGLPIDHRSDIFAVGVLLYEMFTGQRLFLGESDFSTLEKVRAADVPDPNKFVDMPEELARILYKALAREPDDRYQWCSELQEALQQFLIIDNSIYNAKRLAGYMREQYKAEIEEERAKMEAYMAIKPPEMMEAASVSQEDGFGSERTVIFENSYDDDLAGAATVIGLSGEDIQSQLDALRYDKTGTDASSPRAYEPDPTTSEPRREPPRRETSYDRPPPRRERSDSRRQAPPPPPPERAQRTRVAPRRGRKKKSRATLYAVMASLLAAAVVVAVAAVWVLTQKAEPARMLVSVPNARPNTILSVYVDGKLSHSGQPVGAMIDNLEPGVRMVVLRANGFQDAQFKVTLQPGKIVPLEQPMTPGTPGTVPVGSAATGTDALPAARAPPAPITARPQPEPVRPVLVSLEVHSTPAGAQVYLDGQPVAGAQTPTKLANIDASKAHEVTLRLAGYDDFTQAMVVRGKEALPIRARLQSKRGAQPRAAPRQQAATPEETGFLMANVKGGPSEILFRGKVVGHTPVMQLELPVGRHKVQFRRAGSIILSETVNIERGQTSKLIR